MIINYMKVITDENAKHYVNTICFSDPVPSVERKIRKARAEEFIHIFVHQKAKLIEFLEHMVQVTFPSLLRPFYRPAFSRTEMSVKENGRRSLEEKVERMCQGRD